jgi:lysophospholipase L1-like esterase
VAVVVAAGVALVAAAAVVVPLAANASAPSYVALGDSYTAGPGVQPVDSTAPLLCLRSLANYPHLTATALGLSLADRSCSAADTSNMTAAQFPGQAPQFDALTSSTSVVTIGIGGNDNNLFLSAFIGCSITDAVDFLDVGAPCKSINGDLFVNEISADAPNLGQALTTIHDVSPSAKVFVIGYPDVLPQRGNCYPQLPLTTGDVSYLNGVELALNAMLQHEATANGATYVDTYTASIGHDACKSEAVRWIEPVVPGTPDSFPVHPNARGEAADARAVEAALRSAGA